MASLAAVSDPFQLPQKDLSVLQPRQNVVSENRYFSFPPPSLPPSLPHRRNPFHPSIEIFTPISKFTQINNNPTPISHLHARPAFNVPRYLRASGPQMQITSRAFAPTALPCCATNSHEAAALQLAYAPFFLKRSKRIG